MDERSRRAKLNIIVSLLCQAVTLVCGLLIPRLMINSFGSEVYGATASIAQFLAYITLLEGGIGGVARAALYKPLAENNFETVSAIVNEIKRFFRVIAYVFIAYVAILAVSYKSISNVESLDWISTALLVVVISISTFGQYFIGISYSVLLQASQKAYISNIVSVVGTIVNTVMVIILVHADCNIIVVKLVSSIVFVLRPVALWLYVKKHYKLVKCDKDYPVYLTQKTTGLGQHIAFFMHSNTDVVVLTWFANLTSVAVYSVYHMVVSQIQNITSSFSTGMEAVFGDMLARGEKDQLNKTFGYYETLISAVSTVLFSCTAVLIVPFVKLYTFGVTDADYIAPLFAVLLILGAYMTCLRMPYHSMTIAAGHFKQTRMAAYGEVLINIGLSVVLVWNFGLVGVAIGTLAAVMFRFLFYVIYLAKHIFYRSVWLFVKRIAVNTVGFSITYAAGSLAFAQLDISNYFYWILCAIVTALFSVAITVGTNAIFYKKEFIPILKSMKSKTRKREG